MYTFSPGSRIFPDILKHNKERIVQFFDAGGFVLPMILQETVIDDQHFKLQITRLSIHLSQRSFKNPLRTEGC